MIVALVSVETLLLVLLVLLVAGLLRSNAEVLRRLGPNDGQEPAPGPPAGPTRDGTDSADRAAAPLSGTTLDGEPVTLAFDGATSTPTLLAFLTSGCSSCQAFWETLGERLMPTDIQTVIVTKGTDRERPARLRSLAPPGVPVVMSSHAWVDYRVPGAPYFVLVDGGVRGEGVATTWKALASLVNDAIEDQREGAAGARRARDIDVTFAAAGIGPDHPSLYPESR